MIIQWCKSRNRQQKPACLGTFSGLLRVKVSLDSLEVKAREGSCGRQVI
jgi:hypothetical protein